MSARPVSTLTRRELLVASAASVAVLRPGIALGAMGPRDLKRKARRNLRLGVFSSVYGGLPLDEAAKRIKDDGFACVVCDFAFKDVRFDPFSPDWDAVKKITSAFEHNGVRIAGLYGYYNVIHPDEAKRKRGEARMDLLIKNWKRFGCQIISTETGTFNPASEFAEHPKNETPEGYAACKAAFEKLAREAEKTGAIIAIEAYWRNIISSAERTQQLFKDVLSPSLKLTMDPCNYFRNDDLSKMKPMLEDIFTRVGAQTVLAHAKDVRASEKGPDLPAAGKGSLDYPLYLTLLTGLNRPLDLVLEHLSLDEVAPARDYVKEQFEKL